MLLETRDNSTLDAPAGDKSKLKCEHPDAVNIESDRPYNRKEDVLSTEVESNTANTVSRCADDLASGAIPMCTLSGAVGELPDLAKLRSNIDDPECTLSNGNGSAPDWVVLNVVGTVPAHAKTRNDKRKPM